MVPTDWEWPRWHDSANRTMMDREGSPRNFQGELCSAVLLIYCNISFVQYILLPSYNMGIEAAIFNSNVLMFAKVMTIPQFVDWRITAYLRHVNKWRLTYLMFTYSWMSLISCLIPIPLKHSGDHNYLTRVRISLICLTMFVLIYIFMR